MASDQRFLSAALPELKDYLLSNEVFWNVGLDPQLTLGNLLFAEARLEAAGPSAAEKELLGKLAAHKREWRSAWEKKAVREFNSRLRQWTLYLQELSEKPAQFAGQYKTQVRVRVLLELLADETGKHADLVDMDQRLKGLVTEGDFIWDGGEEGAFPKNKFWFLWAKP